MIISKPPMTAQTPAFGPSVFLAGSIEMGAAEDWQVIVEKAMEQYAGIIYNPRRDDWDSSWSQSIDNPVFRQQVNWELEHIEKADIVIFYFDPATKSPITLMELGLVAGRGSARETFVCCPPGFWRKGNVDIICQREGIPVTETLDGLLYLLKQEMEWWRE